MLQVLLVIDFLGIVTGLVSIVMMIQMKHTVGGQLGAALNLFITGVVAMMIAFLWTVLFSRLKVLHAPGGVDIHHLIMTVGMVLFVLAMRKFARIGKA